MMVSVIIPNYNHEPFLHQRIDSVLRQTFQDFEVLILDDCSTDDSRSVINQFRHHPKVSQVVFNEHNSGSPFRQWKKGIELAKGDWIWIAESDDYCAPSLLETLVRHAQRENDVVVSYCQSYQVDEAGAILGSMEEHTNPLSKSRWKEDYCNNGKREIKDFLLHRNTIPNASAVLFRTATYWQIEKQFEDMKLCGDWMFWVQLLKIGSISFCAQPLNYFRTHNASTRTFGSYERRKRRREEEYMIVRDIGNNVPGIEPQLLLSRFTEIGMEYCSYLTKGELVRLLVRPGSYKGKIPASYLRKGILYYIQLRLKSISSRLRH